MSLLAYTYLSGMLVAILLALRFVFVETENRAAAFAFAGFLACSAVFLWDAGFLAAGLFLRWPALYGWSEPFILAIGPFFFLYARATTESGFVWRPRVCVHFIGPLLWLPLLFLWLLVPEAERLQEVQSATQMAETGVHGLVDVTLLAIMNVYHLTYLSAAWRRLWRRRDRVAEEQLEGRSHPVRGIGLFATLVLVIAFVSALLDFSPWPQLGNGMVALAIVLCVFGLLWVTMQPMPFLTHGEISLETLSEQANPAGEIALEQQMVEEACSVDVAMESVVPSPSERSPTDSVVESQAIEDSRKSHAVLTPERERREFKPEELAVLVKRIRHVLEVERAYLDPEFSLQKLASQVGTTRHKLSAALREGLGASFHQLVSGLRVRESARVLRSREGAVRTIADVAFSSGFNTLSAFNAAFRAHFGMTPRQYRDAEPQG